jgi:hypothetical protein
MFDAIPIQLLATLSGGTLLAVMVIWFVRTVVRDRTETIAAQAKAMSELTNKTEAGIGKLSDRLDEMSHAVIENNVNTRLLIEAMAKMQDDLSDMRVDFARKSKDDE